mmetsp:Transcript_4777/g.8206  ORF Transcript_4777/g.8206 Transcript_4777/m.8206 type:complete len:297 (-) Transcript_4777:22-912(-)
MTDGSAELPAPADGRRRECSARRLGVLQSTRPAPLDSRPGRRSWKQCCIWIVSASLLAWHCTGPSAFTGSTLKQSRLKGNAVLSERIEPKPAALVLRAAEPSSSKPPPPPLKKPSPIVKPPPASAASRKEQQDTSDDADVIRDGDVIFLKMWTGMYLGDLDDTEDKYAYPVWVKARGDVKDDDHALIIERVDNRRAQRGAPSSPIMSGDLVRIVMNTGAHMDVVGTGVRARWYDKSGQYQQLTIIKQAGGAIQDGDTIFLRGHQGEYIDAQPNTADGEVKARWKDEGDWQRIVIEI